MAAKKKRIPAVKKKMATIFFLTALFDLAVKTGFFK